ncbi:TonB-dependent receptor domain-containing protein [Nitrosomonas sp. sh817]|uniref:TonB-dependent receptor domain-containing protein n=1 Tax=Nitrosomonas sp. sh817 TaxID=3070658 RepID=UPI0027DB4364|nr:TonB-dependent receptor [Nitrosomonas sp. sh817]WMJ07510.1 TonB-dependent receptor [Nitrosomonas sp. sh817]
MKLLLLQVAEKLYGSNLRMIRSGELFNGALSISHLHSERGIAYLKITAFWSCTAIALLPTAFSQLHIDNAWSEGFEHPLMGWDHILVMVAVGIWAAQIRGQALWILPAVFVGIMSLGGLTGAASYAVPGAEAMVLLSCFMISALIICGVRFSAPANIIIISLFAFFHGYVHGQEISASTSLGFYIAGFVSATLLLHGVGILISWLIVLAFTFFFSTSIHAQGKDLPAYANTAERGSQTNKLAHATLDEVRVTGRADELTGIADAASQGKVGQDQIRYRPMTRPGEILETVPGLIATQHSGEGKANQFFLRGFNLDHGTDFLTQIEGVPVNQLSHAHGQGWTDINFLIPELIESIEFRKGNYYADTGDFSSAGSANIRYFNRLPQNMLRFTGGSFDYYRGLIAGSRRLSQGNVLYAGEIVHNDGPWTTGNNYLKFNGLIRYSGSNGNQDWRITAMGTHSDWRATDQIPRRAIGMDTIRRFDAIDPTDGGKSHRYSLTGEWNRRSENSLTSVMAYGIYSKLDLYSNFSFLLDNNETTNPVGCSGLNGLQSANRISTSIFQTCGDQFGQPDDRWTTGLAASHTVFHKIGRFDSETTLGIQVRNDNIQNALTKAHAQRVYGITRQDSVWVTSVSPFLQNKTQWQSWLRTSMGVRFDGFRFAVNQSNIQQNNGTRYDGLASPKLGIVFGPWANTELYLNGGLGFHSNDARGINTRIDPASGSPVDRADPLARTYSAETGIRSTWIPGLHSTLTAWWMDLQSELVFVGDAGTTEASRPSRRYGIEFTNYYQPVHWLTFDADFSFSHARFRNSVPDEGNHVPNAVEAVIATGATFHDVSGGFYGGPRLRYLGPRALNEDNSKRSDGTILLSAMLGYEFNRSFRIQAEVFNMLDRKDDAITYFYTSRLPGEPLTGVNDFHFHPVEPVSFRVGFVLNY